MRSVLWRLLLVGAVLWWLSARGPLVAPFMWAAFGYLLWRAAPGVLVDFGRLSVSSWPARVTRFRRSGSKGQGLL